MTFLPELLLLFLALLILGLDLILPRERHAFLGWLTAVGCAGILIAALLEIPSTQAEISAGTLQADALAYFFRAIVLLGAALAALMSIDSEGVGRRGEYYALMLFSALGMCLMVSASDLVMLALAIEMATIPLLSWRDRTGFALDRSRDEIFSLRRNRLGGDVVRLLADLRPHRADGSARRGDRA